VKFPKRTESHVVETTSWKILQAATPPEWIIRDVTQRDYGIDCYIELPSKDGDITGDLLVAQLKGVDHLKWSPDKDRGHVATFSGIEQATVNYWMNLPVPVFLFVAEVSSCNLFLAAVKEQVRNRYDEFRKQKSFGFHLGEHTHFGSEIGYTQFVAGYFRERFYLRFEIEVITILTHWAEYFDFISGNVGLDSFMGVEDRDELFFVQIYQTLRFMADFVRVDWKLPSLNDLYKDDAAKWKDGHYRLHNDTFDKALPILAEHLLDTVDKLKELVVVRQGSFWSYEQPLIYRMCLNLSTEYQRGEAK